MIRPALAARWFDAARRGEPDVRGSELASEARAPRTVRTIDRSAQGAAIGPGRSPATSDGLRALRLLRIFSARHSNTINLLTAAASGVGVAWAWMAAVPSVPARPVPHKVERPARAGTRAGVVEDAPVPVAWADAADIAPAAPAPEPGTEQVVDGAMEQVLYGSGASTLDPRVAGEALDLFAHKLDLTRDLALGDRIRLLVRRPERDGRSAGPTLDYAEWRGADGRSVRFYRRGQTRGFALEDFADDHGANARGFLLRTPLARERITSGFGLRLHPVLGYSRRHDGVDFAAAPGTPVLAAGDGTVRAAGWAGGYGRLIRLAHSGGMETVYAHLSAWAPGARIGASVRQGEVIGWTGASGLVTGPHLHFELRRGGRPVDPADADMSAPPVDSAERARFDARRRAIDAMLSEAEPAPARGGATR